MISHLNGQNVRSFNYLCDMHMNSFKYPSALALFLIHEYSIKVLVPTQESERLCICVSGVSNISVFQSTIFILEFTTYNVQNIFIFSLHSSKGDSKTHLNLPPYPPDML